jgi:uncharacterized lipoprotein YmbA
MRGSFYSLTHSIIIGLSLLILTGCASTETPRYYLLNALPGETGTQAPCVSLGVGPIKLPEYLNRPQIVTRATTNELILSQFDRWAEPLHDTFSRVLAENMTRLLCTKSVSIYPWKASTDIDYRVEAEVVRMDGDLGREASLEVWWAIWGGAEKKVLISKQSRLREPVATKDYEALVQAQSRLLTTFSQEVSEAIGKLEK